MLLDIPEGALALGLGTVLALGAAAVVLRPLLGESVGAPPPPPAPSRTAPAEASAVEALREIEFDRATGKLSDVDYAALRATYTREALAELRAQDAAAVATLPAAADDAVETALRDFRARSAGAAGAAGTAGTARCPVHGARPEADARFCSECGRYLAARCPGCGAPCDGEGQRFCGDCGTALAA